MTRSTFLLAPALLLLPLDARADDLKLKGGTAHIVMGQDAGTCEWPSTTVMLAPNPGLPQCGGSTHCLCSGTLIHPQIVMTAGHCLDFPEVQFGEDAGTPPRKVTVDHCKSKTDWALAFGPEDYAYCKLAEPVTDVPITPVAYGCEVDKLVPGADVMLAGFGQNTGTSGAGTKRWGESVLSGADSMYWVGGPTTPFRGDSGGPAFIQMDDGSWRAFGIVSGSAGGAPGYVRMEVAIPWVEQNSGVDVTPCHDVDGTWNPSADCGGFATTPLAGGLWSQGCGDADPLSGPSATCGAPWTELNPDPNPPSVSVLSPEAGQTYTVSPALVEVTVSASDAESSVKRVWLEVDGLEVGAMDTSAPYEFPPLEFPDGAYVIVAKAEDAAGNIGVSAAVGIAVGDHMPPAGSTGTGSGGGAGADSGGGTAGEDAGDTSAGATGGGGGCRQASPAGLPGAALALVGLGLWTRRRRRSAA